MSLYPEVKLVSFDQLTIDETIQICTIKPEQLDQIQFQVLIIEMNEDIMIDQIIIDRKIIDFYNPLVYHSMMRPLFTKELTIMTCSFFNPIPSRLLYGQRLILDYTNMTVFLSSNGLSFSNAMIMLSLSKDILGRMSDDLLFEDQSLSSNSSE